MAEQAKPQTDAPPWYTDVSEDYGDLLALAISHPGKGLLNAIKGVYPGGLEGWVADHPPAPRPEL